MLVRRLLRRLEGLTALDPLAERLAAAVSRATGPTPVKNATTGSWLGHPLHPLLTDLPVGAWTGASLLDLLGGRPARGGADALVAFGVAASVPTIATGAADWADYNDDRVRRVGLVHALANSVGVTLQVASLAARRTGHRGAGTALSLASLGAVAAGGYLGGHLAYGLASGVDRTAFDQAPTSWHDAVEEDVLADGRPHLAHAGAVDVVVVRSADSVHALANTCTHMGGPLAEGEVVDGCIRCPWHASTFRLHDGSVARGPASAPQPVYDARVVAGRVQVRAAHGAEED